MAKLWTETIKEDGTSSLQSHTVRVVKVWCKAKEHYFEFEGGANRIAKCKKCQQEASFIPGFHKIVDGKLIRV